MGFFPITFGHPVTRYCTILDRNAILFPIFNSEYSYIGFPQLYNEIELSDCAKTIPYTVISPSASIDNNELKNLENYRVQSSLFNFSPLKIIFLDYLHKLPKQLQTVTGCS